MKLRLILFDIDGTLILDNGVARNSFARALESVYGFRGAIARYDFSGMTDPEITHMILIDAGRSGEEIEDRLPDFWKYYLADLSETISRDRVRVLAGIDALLELLEPISSVTIGLLTGNIEPGARVKLTPHELNRYFPFGAFGSDSMIRSKLPPIAVERAFELTGRTFAPADVVVIGDSIHDVRCGARHGATTIAVSTGRTRADTLRAEMPSFYFESLEPSDDLLGAIMGS